MIDVIYIRQREARAMLEASKCAPDDLQALADGPILNPGDLYMPLGKISAATLAERNAMEREIAIGQANGEAARARRAARLASNGEAI